MSATIMGKGQGRRLRRDERVEQLLDVAEVLFAEHGYDATSIEQIARAAGISRPIVYQHFGSKDGIYLACLRRARQRLNQAIVQGVDDIDDLENRLLAGIDAVFAFIETDPQRWAVLFNGVALSGPVAEEARELRFATINGIADLVHEASPDIARQKVEAFAHALSGAGEQMERWWRHNPQIPRREIVGYLHSFAWHGLSQLASGSVPESGS